MATGNGSGWQVHHWTHRFFTITTITTGAGEFALQNFQYAAPTTVDDAIQALSEHGEQAKMLAGGTDIIVQLREGMCEADAVIDIKRIEELMQLEYSSRVGLQLGAGVPCWKIYQHAELSVAYPALVDATRIIGGWQIQSRASVGGNLCNASPAADTIPTLIAHNAVCHIAGPQGRRSLPVEQFCAAPGRNILQPGEILVALTFPPPLPKASSAYERFIPRNEMDIAAAGAASWVQLDDTGERIVKARIALGAVAPTPIFAQEASSWLVGQPVNDETFVEAGEIAKKVASPIDDMRGTREYRVHLVGVLTKRTLAKATHRAQAE